MSTNQLIFYRGSGGASFEFNNANLAVGKWLMLDLGLSTYHGFEGEIEVYTDSQYVIKGITEWIIGWKAKNFKGVKNVELWKNLDTLVTGLNVKWIWVKGHAGHPQNEFVDKLAKKAAEAS